MARQPTARRGRRNAPTPGAPAEQARQGFFPDGSRSFEEIDRLSIGADGVGNLISSLADVDFYRVLPPAGYTKACRRTRAPISVRATSRRKSAARTSSPTSRITSEMRRRDPALASLTNAARRILASGKYDGAIWTQGSPQIEESRLLAQPRDRHHDPLCGNAAQRPQGEISNDGPTNIVDSVEYITRASGPTSRAATAPA